MTGYEPPAGYDEAFSATGSPRPHYAALLAALDGHDLERLAERVTRQMRSSGATFGDGEVFRLDPVPRLVTAAEWAELEAGLAQRVRALDAFVDDVYGERRAIEAGVVPEHVLARIGFLQDDLPPRPPPPAAWVGLPGPGGRP